MWTGSEKKKLKILCQLYEKDQLSLDDICREFPTKTHRELCVMMMTFITKRKYRMNITSITECDNICTITPMKLVERVETVLMEMGLDRPSFNTTHVLNEIHSIIMGKYKQNMTLYQIERLLNGYFPELSITESMIVSILHKHGIEVPKYSKWTVEEDSILRTHFLSDKLKLEQLLPLRTWGTIQQRIYKLGLH